jgi:hypothetical protein
MNQRNFYSTKASKADEATTSGPTAFFRQTEKLDTQKQKEIVPAGKTKQ